MCNVKKDMSFETLDRIRKKAETQTWKIYETECVDGLRNIFKLKVIAIWFLASNSETFN